MGEVQRHVWLNGVEFSIDGVVQWRRITPFPAQITGGKQTISDYTPVKMQAWGPFTGGMGLEKWRPGADDRYHYAPNVDCSQNITKLSGLASTLATAYTAVTTKKYLLRVRSTADADLVGATDTTVDGSATAQHFVMTKFTAGASDTGTKFGIKVSGAGNVIVAIYADSAGTPTTRLGGTNTSTAVTTGWNDITITGLAITSGTVYWLAAVSDAAIIAYDTTTATTKDVTVTYSGFTAFDPAYAFGVAPVKLIWFGSYLWGIGENVIAYWDTVGWRTVKTDFDDPKDATTFYDTTNGETLLIGSSTDGVTSTYSTTGASWTAYVAGNASYLAEYESRFCAISNANKGFNYSDVGSLTTNNAQSTFPNIPDSITALFTYKDSNGEPKLACLTPRGMYILDVFENFYQYESELTWEYDSSSGKKGLYWKGDAYVSTGKGILKLSGTTITPYGPDMDDGLPSTYQGVVVDMIGVGNWLVIAVQGNSTTNYSWILKKYITGNHWHCVYCTEAVNNPIRGLCWHDGTLYFAESTDVKSMPFPITTDNYTEDTTYTYSNTAFGAYLYTSWFHSEFEAMKKVAQRIRATTKDTVPLLSTYLSPTSYTDSDSAWTDEAYAYDASHTTYAYCSVPPNEYGKWLVLTKATGSNWSIKFDCGATVAAVSASFILDVDVYDATNSIWVDVFEGMVNTTYDGTEVVKYIDSRRTVTKMRVRFRNPYTSTMTAKVYDMYFGTSVVPAANEAITVAYRTDKDTSWTELGILTGWPDPQPLYFPDGSKNTWVTNDSVGLDFERIQFRLQFTVPTTNTNTPKLEKFILDYRVIPPNLWGWTFKIKCTESGDKSGQYYINALRDCLEANTLLPFYPDGDKSGDKYLVQVTNMPGNVLTGEFGDEGVYLVQVQEVVG